MVTVLVFSLIIGILLGVICLRLLQEVHSKRFAAWLNRGMMNSIDPAAPYRDQQAREMSEQLNRDQQAVAQQAVVLRSIQPGLQDMKYPSSESGANDGAKLEPFTVPFRTSAGEPLPLQASWGALPSSELTPMFVDQFLIRHFWKILRCPDGRTMSVERPWQGLLVSNDWVETMPQLFWQLTSYQLSARQLDDAAELVYERLRPTNQAIENLIEEGHR